MYTHVLQLYNHLPFHQRIFLWLRLLIAPFTEILSFLPTKGTILEVGCGHGLLSNLIALHSVHYRVTGIDIDADRIRLATSTIKNRTNVRFKVQDIRKGLHQKMRYDAVVLFDILHHIPSEDQIRVIQDSVELLNPNGMILIKEINTSPRWKYYWNLFHDYLMTKEFIHCRSKHAWKQILQTYNLKTTTVQFNTGICYPHVVIIGKK